MKGTFLGEFQEVVLLAVVLLDGNAYGVSLQQEINTRLNRNVSRGALHAALKRLEKKGYLRSHFGEATAVRGGRRKKYYTISESGRAAVSNARDIRDGLWNAILNTSN